MSLETALYSLLQTDADVVAAFGDRIYPRVAPQGAEAPYCVRSRVSSPGYHHLGGPSGIASPRYQFSIYARSSEEAETCASVIRAALDGWRGDIGSERVLWVSLEDERDMYEDRGDGSQDGLFRTDLDFVIWHLRS